MGDRDSAIDYFDGCPILKESIDALTEVLGLSHALCKANVGEVTKSRSDQVEDWMLVFSYVGVMVYVTQ